jgi:hypothetical protein
MIPSTQSQERAGKVKIGHNKVKSIAGTRLERRVQIPTQKYTNGTIASSISPQKTPVAIFTGLHPHTWWTREINPARPTLTPGMSFD